MALFGRVVVVALLLVGCDGASSPWPSPPPVALDLQARLSSDSAPLLGAVTLTLDLFRRRDLEVEFEPQLPEGFSGRIELAAEVALGEGRWRRAVLHLRPVRGPGPLPIAPFRAHAKDGMVSVATPALPFTVASLLAGATAALEAPGPLRLPGAPLWPWLVGVLGLWAIVLSWYFVRARRRRPSPALAVAVPAHTKALRELQRLRAVPKKTAAEVEAFYVATSQVLRVYLEERFGLRAPERTTEEFLPEVEAGGPLSAGQCLEVRRFLQQCDLVKFAAQLPADEVHLQTLAIAELLVESTRADRVPSERSA